MQLEELNPDEYNTGANSFDIASLAPQSLGVGYNTLLDYIKAFKILYAPNKHIDRQFSWYASLSGSMLPDSSIESNILILVHLDKAKAVLDASRSYFCFALARDDELPEWINEKPYRQRILVLKKEHHFFEYGSFMQNIFLSNLLWECRMDRIVYNNGKLDALIAASESMLDAFVCITDSGFNLITASKDTPPPSKVYEYLIESNCYDDDEIMFLERQILPQSRRTNQLILSKQDEPDQPPVFHYPVYIDNSYLFHVVMVCTEGKSIDRQKELFLKFMKRIVSICNDFWKTTVNIETPWHRVLLGLINGEAMSMNYQKTQLSLTAIPDAYQFRLIRFIFDDSMTNKARSQFVEESRTINKGLCYPFMFENNLLVLCYSISNNDAMLSLNNINADLEKLCSNSPNVYASSSQIFHEIGDLGLAYRQAVVAYAKREAILREKRFSHLDDNQLLFPFEHALQFYLLDPEHDRSLAEFSFQNSITSKVIKEDEAAGTHLAQLYWTYLANERNATETSKQIHVHRNTVLYHVSKLEKRFDVSLDSPLSRARMLLDYKYLFSTMDDSLAAEELPTSPE